MLFHIKKNKHKNIIIKRAKQKVPGLLLSDSAQFMSVQLLREVFPRSPFNLIAVKYFMGTRVFDNYK